MSAAQQQPAGNVLSFGPTLARKMRVAEIMAHFSKLDALNSTVGMMHVAVCRSHVAGVLNVECLSEDLEPVMAIAGLQIAAQRFKTIHGIHEGRIQFQAVDLYDAELMRKRAEEFVDMCRSATVASVGGNPLHTFKQSRENCVRAAIVLLASASQIANDGEA
jgi:hypothetical protein